MSTESVSALDIQEGDQILYHRIPVTVIGPKEDDPNQFGLPWFRYLVQADDGRKGYAEFGPTGRVARVVS